MPFEPNRRSLLGMVSAFAAVGVAPAVAAGSNHKERARAIMDRSIVINGNMPVGFSDPANDPPFVADVRATGLTAVKLSIGGAPGTFSSTVAEIGMLNNAITDHEHVFMPAFSIANIVEAKRNGKIGIFYAFEDAGMLEGKPERINYFHTLGVRSMQLSYNGVSPFASGVMSPEPSLGLTEKGVEAVVTMNAAGVTIDVSHSDDKSTLEIIEQSNKPVMISHGGCDAIHAHQRNKSDAILKAVAEQGGVFGLYEMSYLTPSLEQQTLTDFMHHLLHALNVCGEDHVGIGSDSPMLGFDTGPESMKFWNALNAKRKKDGVAAPGEGPPPYLVGANSPERHYVIAEELLKAGYSETVVEKVLGANFLRVFKETWR